MAERLIRSTYNSTAGMHFSIDIVEIDVSLPEATFISSNCVISVSAKDMFDRIVATKVTFTMKVNSDLLRGFVDRLKSGTDSQFIVRIRRDGFILFRGYLVPQGITRDDGDPNNYDIVLTAACGLGRLRSIKFDPFVTFPLGLPPLVSMFDIIKNIFTQTKIIDLYESSEYLIVMKMFHTSLRQDIFKHALNEFMVSAKAFANDRGVYVTCYRALEYIMNAFNSRIVMVDGRFAIRNLMNMKTAHGTLWAITKDGTDAAINSGYSWYDSDVKFDENNLSSLRVGKYSYLPEPKATVLEFTGGGGNNIAGDVDFSRDTIGTEYDLGFVIQDDNIGQLRLYMITDGSAPLNAQSILFSIYDWTVYELEIKVGNRYLTGSHISWEYPETHFMKIPDEITNDPPTWSGVAGTLKLYAVNYVTLESFFIIEDLPPFPLSDYLTIKMTDAYYADYTDLSVRVTNPLAPSPFTFTQQELVILVNATDATSTVNYTIEGEPANSEILELTTQFGDVPLNFPSSQQIYVEYQGSLYQTTNWNNTGLSLQKVILSEIAAMRAGTLEIYNGAIWDKDPYNNNMVHTNRVVYKGKTYNFLSAAFDTNNDTVSGQWYELSDADITVDAGTITTGYTAIEPDTIIQVPIPDPTAIAPPKSYNPEVKLKGGDVLIETFEDVTDDYVEVTIQSLPDATDTSKAATDIIRSQVKVYSRSHYLYNPAIIKRHHVTFDNATNRIYFISPLRGADITVEFVQS